MSITIKENDLRKAIQEALIEENDKEIINEDGYYKNKKGKVVVFKLNDHTIKVGAMYDGKYKLVITSDDESAMKVSQNNEGITITIIK